MQRFKDSIQFEEAQSVVLVYCIVLIELYGPADSTTVVIAD